MKRPGFNCVFCAYISKSFRCKNSKTHAMITKKPVNRIEMIKWIFQQDKSGFYSEKAAAFHLNGHFSYVMKSGALSQDDSFREDIWLIVPRDICTGKIKCSVYKQLKRAILLFDCSICLTRNYTTRQKIHESHFTKIQGPFYINSIWWKPECATAETLSSQ